MKYKYKLNNEVEAMQFGGDGIADLIILEEFLGTKPEILYLHDGGRPMLRLKNLNGFTFMANIADFIIKVTPGNYIAVPYQSFIKLYGSL